MSADDERDPFEEMARRAGSEVRREPPADGVIRLERARRRRRTVTASAVGAIVVGLGAAAAIVAARAGDDGGAPVVEQPTSTVGPPASTPAPSAALSTAPPPPASTTLPSPAAGRIDVGGGTSLWAGDGVLLGAVVDGAFVPYDAAGIAAGTAPAFVAPGIDTWDAGFDAAPAIAMRDRTGEFVDAAMYDEGCGAIVVRLATAPDRVMAGGWLATADLVNVTLDGIVPLDDPALDQAIAEAFVGAGRDPAGAAAVEVAGIPVLTGDVQLALVTLPGSDGRPTWYAAWHTAEQRLVTIAGDPSADAPPFEVNGEGTQDIDGDGVLDITVRAGDDVRLVSLGDGRTLAQAHRCPTGSGPAGPTTSTSPPAASTPPRAPSSELAVAFAGGGAGAWAPIGWWDGAGWVDPEDFPSAPASPIESVVAVGPGLTDGPLTGLTLGEPGDYCAGPELGRYIDLGRTLPDADLYRGYGALAVTADWNVQPRPVVPAGADAPVYQQVGESFVGDRPDVDPTLGDVTEVYRSDLNGDGIEEVIFGFEHLADTAGIGAAGDFSLVIARLPHPDGTVDDQVLFEHFSEDPVTFPNPGRGSVLAIADLNGDAVMEVVVRSVFWEASVAEAFELQGDRLVRVMSGGCGV